VRERQVFSGELKLSRRVTSSRSSQHQTCSDDDVVRTTYDWLTTDADRCAVPD